MPTIVSIKYGGYVLLMPPNICTTTHWVSVKAGLCIWTVAARSDDHFQANALIDLVVA